MTKVLVPVWKLDLWRSEIERHAEGLDDEARLDLLESADEIADILAAPTDDLAARIAELEADVERLKAVNRSKDTCAGVNLIGGAKDCVAHQLKRTLRDTKAQNAALTAKLEKVRGLADKWRKNTEWVKRQRFAVADELESTLEGETK